MARKSDVENLERLKKTGDFWYGNIFLVGSLLYAGNVIEYFSCHSQKLVVFFLNKTLKDKADFIRIYKRGKLDEEKVIFTGKLPVLYYLFVYYWYLRIIFQYFTNKENFFVITFHPLFFFLNSLLKIFKNFEIIFWIADYLPSTKGLLKLYQWTIFYFHKKNKYNLYLSDKVNEIMNGRIKTNFCQKTVMWGTKLRQKKQEKTGNKITLGFIGIVKPSQGLEIAFLLLQKHPDLSLKILGECEQALYKKYLALIKRLKIGSQIIFTNQYCSEEQLSKELGVCDVGLALYSQDKENPIYYTDSGKIKTYLEFGLPVVMTATSATLPFVKQFKAGEIVKPDVFSLYQAIKKIKNNYSNYLDGVKKFNEYFDVEKYYRKAFRFLEI